MAEHDENEIEQRASKHKEILSRLKVFLETKDDGQIQEMRGWIEKTAPMRGVQKEHDLDILDDALREESLDRAFTMLTEGWKSFIDFYIDHPDVFEKIRRENLIEQEGNLRLSELLYYQLDTEREMAVVHVASGETFSNTQVLEDFLRGLRQLAEDAKRDERIKTVVGSSPLVAARPKAFQYLGFDLDGPISEEERVVHFAHETRPVAKVSMSRKKLLKKYG